MFVSEQGDLRIIDQFDNQSFGSVTVANETDISATYKVVPEFGGTLFDGSEFADCTFAGTIQERQSMIFEVDCQTSIGGQFGGGDIVLTYDPGYELDSNIARIAGTYQNLSADGITVDANGLIFGQSVQTGCIIDGGVSSIDPDWNLYSVSFSTEACVGDATPLNGADWAGTAAIAIVDGVDFVIGGVIANIGGRDWSIIFGWQRI